ncbi:hypothetical protein GCM10027430_14240 [Lysobacter tyrosinilyticus]
MNRDLQMKALAAATLLALASGNAAAAKRVELSKLDLKSLNRQYAASIAVTGAPKMNHSRHEQLLGVEQDSYLVMQSSNRSGPSVNRRYKQTFRGLPIFGENLVVSEDAQGNVQALFGRKIDGLASDIASTTPRLTSAQALAAAKRAALGNRTVVGNEKVELQVYVDAAGRASLAYAVDFVADTPRRDSLSRPIVLIDALNGRVLAQYENLQTDLVGTGPGGNAKMGQYEYGSNGKPFLDVTQSGTTCSMENADVKVINANHTGNTSTGAFNYNVAAYSYTCPRNTFQTINGGYSPINDVMHNTGVVMQMYRDWTGATPIAGKLMSAVHYANSWDNAAWNGTGMVYGDGSSFYPLVSLDVSSHEVSHGFTEQHSGLGPYYNSQAGCMNEAYSDMSGEAAEYYDRNGTVDWMVGAEIKKSAGALRYMDDPTRDGQSIANASQYNTSIDPHLCSGVYNKAFYNLAHMNGWNTKTAWLSFQRANRDYWASTATFATGAQGVVKAACDLGYSGQDVVAAFNTVGVNAGAVPAGCGGVPGNSNPVANFSSSVNGLTVSFTDSSTDSDGSITARSWAFGDGTTSTATNPSKTYTAGGTYTVTLTVTDNAGATNTKTSSVTVVDPNANVLTNGVAKTGLSGAAGSSQTYSLVVPAGATGLKFVSAGGTGDADMYVKFGAQPSTTVYDCKSEGSTTAETCNIATAQAGTYYVLIKGYAAYSGMSLTGSYTAGGGGGAQTYSNAADYSIPDNNATGISSPITVSGRTGNGPTNASISVNVVHTYVGDLKLDLIAPDGTVYNLRSNTGGSADNIVETYTKDVSTEALNGTWKLRVIDNAGQDTGYINSWSVTF